MQGDKLSDDDYKAFLALKDYKNIYEYPNDNLIRWFSYCNFLVVSKKQTKCSFCL